MRVEYDSILLTRKIAKYQIHCGKCGKENPVNGLQDDDDNER